MTIQELNHETHERIRYANEVSPIQGAIFEVRRQMGVGFLEAVYQECLALEFSTRKMPFETLPEVALSYKGERLNQTYIPDFVCFGSIIVELKACQRFAPEHRAQVLNYLRATGMHLGLLVNFCAQPVVAIERLAL